MSTLLHATAHIPDFENIKEEMNTLRAAERQRTQKGLQRVGGRGETEVDLDTSKLGIRSSI